MPWLSCHQERRTRFLLRFGRKLDAERETSKMGMPLSLPQAPTSESQPKPDDDGLSDMSELSDLFEAPSKDDAKWLEEDRESGILIDDGGLHSQRCPRVSCAHPLCCVSR
jgi:hypothetical protein